MPILFVNPKTQTSLTRAPYHAFTEKYNHIKGNLDNKEIEVHIDEGKNGFTNGFYVDAAYEKNHALTFSFAQITPGKNIRVPDKSVFARMAYSYEFDDSSELQFQLKKIQTIKQRIPYLYIPDTTHFEFHTQIDTEKVELYFDIIVSEEDKLLSACYCLINTLIALLCFDD